MVLDVARCSFLLKPMDTTEGEHASVLQLQNFNSPNVLQPASSESSACGQIK